jgi:hypothetical protein
VNDYQAFVIWLASCDILSLAIWAVVLRIVYLVIVLVGRQP